jgi:hypothetical protein
MRFFEFNDNRLDIPQPDESDMLPNSASARYKVANNKFYLDQRNPGYETRTPLMMRPAITDSTMKVIPARDGINDVTRRAKINGGKTKLLGTRPQSGTGRNEPKGLATMAMHQSGSIMKNADNFYPMVNSQIPMIA